MSLPRLLVEAAERWGTPLYVTDLDAASAAAHAWRDALPGALVAYAVKANPDPALLRRLAAEGFGFEVVGPIELALALRAGGTPGTDRRQRGRPDRCRPRRRAGDRRPRQRRVARRARGADRGRGAPAASACGSIPGLDADTHPHLATGSADAKFGIALGELPAALERLRSAGVRPASIGAHIGSDIADLGAVRAARGAAGRAGR